MTVVVSATDPSGATAWGAVNITVINAAPVYVGRVYDQQTSQDATGTLSFGVPGFEDPDGDPVRLTAVLQGTTSLPPWIHFDAASARFSVDGSGAPADSYVLVVTGEDSTGARNSVTMKLDVQARAVVPSSGSQTLQQMAQYGTPVLFSTLLLLLAGAAFTWRHRRIQRTTGRVRAWSATVLRRAAAAGLLTLDFRTEPVSFLSVQRAHSHFLSCASQEVVGESLEAALRPLEQAAYAFYGAIPGADADSMEQAFLAFPVKRVCRALVGRVFVSVFGLRDATRVVGCTLAAARALHRYLQLILTVYAGRGFRLAPQLKQALFRCVSVRSHASCNLWVSMR